MEQEKCLITGTHSLWYYLSHHTLKCLLAIILHHNVYVAQLQISVLFILSLRNLCRALQYAASHCCGSFYRSLYEVMHVQTLGVCTFACVLS